MPGLDFTNTWFMVDGSTRPFLRSEFSTTIDNAHQLQLMAMILGASYTLGRDIDATATSGANVSDMWTTAGSAPIGADDVTPFRGSLDGQNHVIDGLFINRPTTDNVGLFGYTTDATIANVGLTNATVTGANNVGGLCRRSERPPQHRWRRGHGSGSRVGHGLVRLRRRERSKQCRRPDRLARRQRRRQRQRVPVLFHRHRHGTGHEPRLTPVSVFRGRRPCGPERRLGRSRHDHAVLFLEQGHRRRRQFRHRRGRWSATISALAAAPSSRTPMPSAR